MDKWPFRYPGATLLIDGVKRLARTTVSTQLAHVVEIADRAEDIERQAGSAAACKLVARSISREQLVEAVAKGSELVRRKSLTLMYYLDVDWCTPLMISVLRSDPSSIVRHEAAFYAAATRHQESVAALIEALLHDSSDLVRHEAAEGLGDIGAIEALEPLQKAAAKDRSEIVVATAKISLEQLTYSLDNAERSSTP